ncbi:MAG TPA: hypothetical protein VHB98_04360, partial [Chloroflexota bacterium]|nr:hypothetical protein [Chloroflexota bacterium]
MKALSGSRRAGITTLAVSCLLAGCLAPLHAVRAQVTPPFPLLVRHVQQVAQLIGPAPSSPFAPYAPSPHSINDSTRWGICSGDLGSLIYAQDTAYIALGDNYTSC